MEMTPEERRKHLAKFDPFVGIDKLCKSDAILPMPSIGNSSQSFSSKSHETMETFSSEDEESFKWEDVPDLKTSASEVKVVTSSEARGSSRRVVLPGVTSTCTSSTITSPESSTDATNESSLGESACARNIGHFKTLVFPSTSKAQKIIDKNGVGNFPGSESNRVVISLSQGDVCHTVTISRSRQVQCDEKCPKYKLHKLCAHTIAVAYKCGLLYDVCRSYKQSVSSMVQSLIPPDVEKKENEKKSRKRKSQKGYRDVSGFNNRNEVVIDDALVTNSFEVVFITDMSALCCYGCNGRVRQKPSDPVPGDPYDIFLRRKEHRVFRKRGSKSTAISISKQPEYVYYHPLRSCVPEKGKIWAELSTKLRFNEKQKELLWREFGLQL